VYRKYRKSVELFMGAATLGINIPDGCLTCSKFITATAAQRP
jgi:hypothetical protein